MKLYLAPEPSLEIIRHLRSVNGPDGLEGHPVRKRALRDAINTTRGIHELDRTAQLALQHVSRPIQAFVHDKSLGTKTKHLVTRVFSQEATSGLFLDLGHGICICTPQFSFLQLGARLSLPELLAMGMELCGSYSRWPLDTEEHAAERGGDRKSRGCTFDVPPVMSAIRLQPFVERMIGQSGAVGARKALPWLLDGSASPQETAIYLLLCLPRRYGGYGLPKPLLNPKLIISGPHGAKVRYPDLYWPGAGIDIEYNGDSTHSGEWARYRDSKREIELVAADVRVLPLTRPQLMDAVEFDEFAQRLRKMLGVRTRPSDPEWAGRRGRLRQALLFDS